MLAPQVKALHIYSDYVCVCRYIRACQRMTNYILKAYMHDYLYRASKIMCRCFCEENVCSIKINRSHAFIPLSQWTWNARVINLVWRCFTVRLHSENFSHPFFRIHRRGVDHFLDAAVHACIPTWRIDTFHTKAVSWPRRNPAATFARPADPPTPVVNPDPAPTSQKTGRSELLGWTRGKWRGCEEAEEGEELGRRLNKWQKLVNLHKKIR